MTDNRCSYCGEDHGTFFCAECARMMEIASAQRIKAANYEMRLLLLRIIDRDDIADILREREHQLYRETCAIVYYDGLGDVEEREEEKNVQSS